MFLVLGKQIYLNKNFATAEQVKRERIYTEIVFRQKSILKRFSANPGYEGQNAN